MIQDKTAGNHYSLRQLLRLSPVTTRGFPMFLTWFLVVILKELLMNVMNAVTY